MRFYQKEKFIFQEMGCFRGRKYMKKRLEFTVVIEKDEDGIFIASVPELKGCHTQAKSLDTLLKRIKEAIELCLEVEKIENYNEFIGVQKVEICR